MRVLQAGREYETLPLEEKRMTTVDFIIALFYQVHEHIRGLHKHPQATRWPSEVVTLELAAFPPAFARAAPPLVVLPYPVLRRLSSPRVAALHRARRASTSEARRVRRRVALGGLQEAHARGASAKILFVFPMKVVTEACMRRGAAQGCMNVASPPTAPQCSASALRGAIPKRSHNTCCSVPHRHHS